MQFVKFGITVGASSPTYDKSQFTYGKWIIQ